MEDFEYETYLTLELMDELEFHPVGMDNTIDSNDNIPY